MCAQWSIWKGRQTGLWFATGPTIHAFETWFAAMAWVAERTGR